MVDLQEKQCTIVKRNGMFVPFDRNRIIQALEAAFRDTRRIDDHTPLPEDLESSIRSITQQVVKEVVQKISDGQVVTVERIQDMVENQLYINGLQDVARDYIVYRGDRKAHREKSWQSLSVIRRCGTVVHFNPMKISAALEKAFRATERIEGVTPDFVREEINTLTQKIVSEIEERCAQQDSRIDIEQIQDIVEQQLMVVGHYAIAKNYILYREARARVRDNRGGEDQTIEKASSEEAFDVLGKDGSTYKITHPQLLARLARACSRFPETTDAALLTDMAFANFYSGIKESEVVLACIMAARANIEKEPDYAFVAAELLLDVVYQEALGRSRDAEDLEQAHREHFKRYITEGDAYRLNAELKNLFDLDALANAMDLSRDLQFSYMGIQNLYDRYFNHHEGRRLETPQIFWMRVAMGLALNEQDKTS